MRGQCVTLGALRYTGGVGKSVISADMGFGDCSYNEIFLQSIHPEAARVVVPFRLTVSS
jgi:hypothetical protein